VRRGFGENSHKEHEKDGKWDRGWTQINADERRLTQNRRTQRKKWRKVREIALKNTKRHKKARKELA
jgi:hypothetical protein